MSYFMCNQVPAIDERSHIPEAVCIKKIISNMFNLQKREFGCERCTLCTINTIEIINKWLEEAPHQADLIGHRLETFVAFPRALKKIIETCLVIANKDKIFAEEFLAEIDNFTNDMIVGLNTPQKEYLRFSRAAAVLICLKENLHNVYDTLGRAEQINTILNTLQEKAKYLVGLFNHQDNVARWLKEERDYGEEERDNKRAKRVCGGGYFFYDGDPIYVLDFSFDGFYGIVQKEFTMQEYEGKFMPCQRELPFDATVMPRTRAKSPAVINASDVELNKTCGNYYQIFWLKEISNTYYYLSLCKELNSIINHNIGHRLIETYCWDKPEVTVGVS